MGLSEYIEFSYEFVAGAPQICIFALEYICSYTLNTISMYIPPSRYIVMFSHVHRRVPSIYSKSLKINNEVVWPPTPKVKCFRF